MSKQQNVYAFIDSQNLNAGTKRLGWTLNFRKFRQMLREKYGVSKAYIFIGMVAEQKALYENLRSMDYELVFKPTIELPDGTIHGNVDADLVLHTMIEYPNYDKAIIVSGDGDFRALVEYLAKQDKLLKLLVPNERYSSMLRDFNDYIVRVDKMKGFLELKKKKPSSV